MGIFSIFNFLSGSKLLKFVNFKTIGVVLLVALLAYDYFRISSLKKDIIILNQKIEKVTKDRDDCWKINRDNVIELDKIRTKYEENEKKYSGRIKKRDAIIATLRRDLKFMKKKLNQKPSKVIEVKECKIPVIEGKDLKDEEFKNLYNSLSSIGK